MSDKTNNKGEEQNILAFIKNISQKNYSQANKYLQEVLDSKLKDRIKTASENKLY